MIFFSKNDDVPLDPPILNHLSSKKSYTILSFGPSVGGGEAPVENKVYDPLSKKVFEKNLRNLFFEIPEIFLRSHFLKNDDIFFEGLVREF
jgi:hypothetical protein